MAQVLVGDLNDEEFQRLKERAERNGRTPGEEIELILNQAAGIEGLPASKRVEVIVTQKE